MEKNVKYFFCKGWLLELFELITINFLYLSLNTWVCTRIYKHIYFGTMRLPNKNNLFRNHMIYKTIKYVYRLMDQRNIKYLVC